MELTTVTGTLIGLAVALLIGLVILLVRRRARTPRAQLAAGSRALLEQILIPDGEGGQIHIEYALLCARGIVLVNIKDVTGNVFGSDSMQEWAVITDKSRFAFRNPQDGLYDRLAAARRLLPDVPVHGYIAFTANAEFTKGIPTNVVMFDALVQELQDENARQVAVDAYLPAWEKLQAAATRLESG